MNMITYGGAGDLPPVKVSVPNDKWENAIREYGVVAACEWFGCSQEFAEETVAVLRAREAS